MKNTIQIYDMDPQGLLVVDLRHVLQALGPPALQSEWKVQDVWATSKDTGNAGEQLEALTPEVRISGTNLLELANNVVQVIDGQFEAFRPNAPQPWVRIIADDSTFYEVETDEDEVANSILRSFNKTERK